jgi:hypothetical protein
LGEFSPVGRLFSLGSFLKITEEAQMVGLLFFYGKILTLILTKKGWASFCTIFSTNNSGHPGLRSGGFKYLFGFCARRRNEDSLCFCCPLVRAAVGSTAPNCHP